MKKRFAGLIALAVLCVAAVLVVMSYHIIDFKFYPKKAEILDLRGKEITAEHYQRLQEKLPDCNITWDVPLQGTTYPSDSRELAVTDLEETMQQLPFFPALETLDLNGCGDLSSLAALRETAPHLRLRFEISQEGKTYARDSDELTLASFGGRELALLPAMENLRMVTVAEGADAAHLSALKAHCQEKGIELRLLLNGKTLTDEDKELTVENVTEPQAKLLRLASWLETLHLTEPEAKAETVLALAEELKDTEVTWEKTVLGLTFRHDATEIDLTPVIALAEGEELGTKTAYEYGLAYPVMGKREEIPSTAKVMKNHPFPDKTEQTAEIIAEAEAAMGYFPKAEKLMMCGAWLDNEAVSQLRERNRENYKVVWSVQCGDVAPRTDTTFFMPTKYGVGSGGFNELYTDNLKYCEEIISMDIGHMQVVNIEFLRYMPNLKYLVLFSQPVYDLTPLAECKNLVFLELSMCSWITDYTPLQGCTALEDLNIEQSSGDISPVLEMTWLKNLWLGDCGKETYQTAQEALPETNIVYSGNNKRWRSLPNYFNARDALLMFYMQ